MVIKLSWMFWGMASSFINRQTQVNQARYHERRSMLFRSDRPSKDLYRKEMIVSETYEYKYKNG